MMSLFLAAFGSMVNISKYKDNNTVGGMNSQDARYQKTKSLLPQTEKIRNVTIVAHVDHGKTTLADCLLAGNNIIHRKQAGHLRLLDSRRDEQDRGITMKSTSISLTYQDHLINIIDSPGHLQFHSQVSSALRLTDSALLVIDTVEGISSQTFRILQQLFIEKLPAVLVLNKIDKLITQYKMDPSAAYAHLTQIIEQVNANLASFINKQEPTTHHHIWGYHLDKLPEYFYFSPVKNNVVFGSALDNWGFSMDNFANLFASKVNKSPEEVMPYLWGDYYFNPKIKEFSTEPRSEEDKPVCVDFVLKPIWTIFQAVESKNEEAINKIVTKLNIKISEKKVFDFQLTKQILNAWLPLDRVIFQKIIQILPNPRQGQKFRLPHLLQMNINTEQAPSQKMVEALSNCAHNEPFVAFISKMIQIPTNNFSEHGLNEMCPPQSYHSLGFARIFSGRIRRGDAIRVMGGNECRIDNIYILNAQHPEGIQEAYAGNIVGLGCLEHQIFKWGTLSTMPDCLSFIPISARTKSILKVSVSTPNIQDAGKLLQGLRRLHKSDPSLDVFVQPNGDIILDTCGEVHLQKCKEDLEQIYCRVPISTSDPIITFKETITWEAIKEVKNEKYIAEVQLKAKQAKQKEEREKTKLDMMMDAELDDHQKFKQEAIDNWDSHVQRYNAEDLTVTDTRYFLVNYNDEKEEKYNYKKEKEVKRTDHRNRGRQHLKQKFLNLSLKKNYSSISTPNLQLILDVRAVALPFPLAQYFQKNSDRIKKMAQPHSLAEEIQLQLRDIDPQMQKLICNNLLCFGPDDCGPNLLLSPLLKQESSLLHRMHTNTLQSKEQVQLNEELVAMLADNKTSVSEAITSIKLGFELATASGPLCQQPMMGAIFIVEGIRKGGKGEEYGPLSGQIASAMKEVCLDAFLGASPRLVEPMYMCELHTDQKYLGGIYHELSKRRAVFLTEDLHEFSNFFIIQMYLPVLESKGLCFDILDKTQGTVHAQLDFATWNIFPEDPFYTPLTHDEIQEQGVENIVLNPARLLLEKIRQKKGLTAVRKIVTASDKQRTLKRK